jgi:hypothetical protein
VTSIRPSLEADSDASSESRKIRARSPTPPPALTAAIRESPALARRFEGIVFDWDGAAVPNRHADAGRLRELVEAASVHGLELAVVSGTHVGNVDRQLQARPAGPGGLILAVNRGSEVFPVDLQGRAVSPGARPRPSRTRRCPERRR